ncbi:MAG: TRAP transporter large permease [Betaproteobacteria bacterium]|nr:TRAP transporter large permease [Betaproteobacteria bacterium]
MSEALVGSFLLGSMFALFAIGLEIAFSMALVGIAGLLFLSGWKVGLGVIGSIAWSNATSFTFIALPLFIFMSAILMHSGVGKGLFSAIAKWVGFLPGGMAVASVISCAVFSAVSGSSVATAATIGMIAIPEMLKRGYAKPLIIGSLAAGGTLGILIPPSVPMILYGVMTETSIGHLYAAGMIPGLLLALIFCAYVIGYALRYPNEAPASPDDRATLGEKLRGLREIWPVAVLITVVLGAMYAGIVTPTEAAALGCLVSLLIAMTIRALSVEVMKKAFLETVRVTSMVMLIIIFSGIFSHVIALLGMPKALLSGISSLGLPAWGFFVLVFTALLVIAYALEELSVMIIILPILFPLVTAFGFDPVWFGIIMVVWLEIGFITPPVGLNLFVIQGMMPESTAGDVIRGTTPFVLLMILLVALLFVFPEIALWLPRQMMTGPK